MVFFATVATGATETDMWRESNDQGARSIDHRAWTDIVSEYIEEDTPSGVNLFRYADVTEKDQEKLDAYIKKLEGLDPRNFPKQVQKAYWINLYNAATVDLILENYPLETIRDLGEGFFSSGPWDDPAVSVAGESLTLNDIEHEILRPIWQDPRIHYVVNCASYGCPDLVTKAYTADNVDQLLKDGAVAYINHDRGVMFDDGDLRLSSIYTWYQEDFDNSEAGVIEHLKKYAKPPLKEKLAEFEGDIVYDYDWSLNEPG
jgi:hypothetical protein